MMEVDQIVKWCDDEIVVAEEFISYVESLEDKITPDLAYLSACSIGRVETLKQLKGDILGDPDPIF